MSKKLIPFSVAAFEAVKCDTSKLVYLDSTRPFAVQYYSGYNFPLIVWKEKTFPGIAYRPDGTSTDFISPKLYIETDILIESKFKTINLDGSWDAEISNMPMKNDIVLVPPSAFCVIETVYENGKLINVKIHQNKNL